MNPEQPQPTPTPQQPAPVAVPPPTPQQPVAPQPVSQPQPTVIAPTVAPPPPPPPAPRSLTADIYPEVTQEITDINTKRPSPNVGHALAVTEARANEFNKPVSQRAKSLLVLAVLMLVASFYQLFAVFSSDSSSDSYMFIVGLILVQLGMSVYFIISKDEQTVQLLLKILVILQAIGTVLSLFNPAAAIISGVLFLYMLVVYMNVKSLSANI